MPMHLFPYIHLSEEMNVLLCKGSVRVDIKYLSTAYHKCGFIEIIFTKKDVIKQKYEYTH